MINSHTAKQAIQYIISESKTGTVQTGQSLWKECWAFQTVAACVLCALCLISNLWAWCFPDSWYMDTRSKTVGVNNIRFVRNEIPAKTTSAKGKLKAYIAVSVWKANPAESAWAH